jgi:hypothetical protein
MTVRDSVLLVSPPHYRRPLVYEIGERLDVTVCSWLGTAWSAQGNESEETGIYKQRNAQVPDLQEGERMLQQFYMGSRCEPGQLA